MGRGRLLVFGLFVAGAIAAMAGYAYFNFEQPPGFSELPDGWFVRPGREPEQWQALAGRAIGVETTSLLNLEIIPEDRADVSAVLIAAPGAMPHDLSPGPKGSFYLGGDLKPTCPATSRRDAPTLTLHTPRSVQVRANGAIAAHVAPAQSLQIVSTGCAVWRIDGASQLWAALAKGGSLQAGAVEDVHLNLRGRSTADLASVARSLDLVSRGPTTTRIGHLDGMVDAELWGRGALDLGSGFVGQERLWLKGRGHVFHRGEAGIVSAEARRGGKIRIAAARGVISGAGDVDVGRPKSPVTGF